MGIARSLGPFMAAAIISAGTASARDIDGWDPFRPPATELDRLPDDYVNDRPYWRPPPGVPMKSAKPEKTKPLRGNGRALTTAAPPPSHPVPAPTTQVPAAPGSKPIEAMAADLPVQYEPYRAPILAPVGFVGYPLWEAEFGGRYFGSSGRTRKDLFGDPPGSNFQLNSRLTYQNLTAHSGEAFGRVEHSNGFFLKGFVGGGILPSGTLKDEDFPPALVPYSSTISNQRDGRLFYGAIDGGWAWRGQDFKLGFFVGYFHYFERVNAFGCTQTAGNPFVCAPGDITPSTLGIREDTNWDAARFGINAEWKMSERWKLTTEFAWLPFVNLSASDTHFQRLLSSGCPLILPNNDNGCLSGPGPEKGIEVLSSVQIEAMLSYAVTDAFWLGIGGRYWNIHTNPGHVTVDFPDAVAPVKASMTFKTERMGVFVQGSYKFGNLQPSGRPSSHWEN